MIDYFDLNKRFQHSLRNTQNVKASGRNNDEKFSNVKLLDQLIIYFFLLVGVIFSTAVLQYIQTTKAIFSYPTVIEILLYCMISLFIFPNIYGQIVSNPPKPILVQIGIAIQNGICYQVVIKAIMKTVSSS